MKNKSLQALKGINTIINEAIEKDLLTLKGSIKLISYSSVIEKNLERLEQLEEENETLNKALDIAKADYTTTRINLDNASVRIKDLEKENQELKEIIKANFFYHEYSEEIGYRKPMPKYQDKIKEVLKC